MITRANFDSNWPTGTRGGFFQVDMDMMEIAHITNPLGYLKKKCT